MTDSQTDTQAHPPSDSPTSFEHLLTSSDILKDVRAAGFTNATPIQARAIPVIREGRDIIGAAKTGSGKTAAFLIPLIEATIKHHHRRRALVLAPTRELAQQIEEVALTLGRSSGFRAITLVGGVSIRPQTTALMQPWHLVIATPGRLIDHMQQETIRLDTVHHLVLDEADRMLDMGFLPQLKRILRALPSERQTLLFSATIPPDLSALVSANMKEPTIIEVDRRSTTNERIEQNYLMVDRAEKDHVLRMLIRREEGRVLVFTRTKIRADKVAVSLSRSHIKVARIHSDRSQAQRNNALDGFKAGRYRVLIATDIAARGIDVTDIKHVINYDIPMHAEDYVHRIGRTARGENGAGMATTLVTPEDRQSLRDIERFIGQKVPRWSGPLTEGMPVLEADVENVEQPPRSEQRPRQGQPGGGNRQRNRSGGGRRPSTGQAQASSGQRHGQGQGAQTGAPRPGGEAGAGGGGGGRRRRRRSRGGAGQGRPQAAPGRNEGTGEN